MSEMKHYLEVLEELLNASNVDPKRLMTKEEVSRLAMAQAKATGLLADAGIEFKYEPTDDEWHEANAD